MSEKKKPTAEEQDTQTYVQVETGIYRYKDQEGNITYHERPWIKGKRTWKSLGVNFTQQPSIKNAREEYHRRRTEVAAGRNPYETKSDEKPKEPEPKPEPTVSEIIREYVEAQYPDRYLKPRIGRTLDSEKANCETLLCWWNGQIWSQITPKTWDDYHAWRTENVKAGCTGDSSTDKERVTLSNAFKLAMRKERVTSNPAQNFPRHHPLSAVKHCREFQPRSAEELHWIAGMLFEDMRSWGLAFQMLFEANTGLRTEEVLMLRVDAKAFGEPGFVDPEGNLHVVRVKHGINPFVHVHDGLKQLLKVHAVWHAICHPDHPYFIPGKIAGKPADKDALAHALRRLRGRIGRKVTSHGMRAFYVLIRRSWGIDDAIIAVELGQGSGAALIATVYGDVPANWRNGGGPKMRWLPAKPAWKPYAKNGWTKAAKVHKRGWKRGAKAAA